MRIAKEHGFEDMDVQVPVLRVKVRPTLKDKYSIYGQWTYRAAWGLEITAAVLGLLTGVALGVQAYLQSTDVAASHEASSSTSLAVTPLDLVLQSAPFFMVALAELTKIPIATLLFGAKWKWKPVLLVFLLLLAGITFETVSFGLERANTLRQIRFNDLSQSIRSLQQEKDELQNGVNEANAATEVDKQEEKIQGLLKVRDTELKSIDDSITGIDARLHDPLSSNPQYVELNREIATKQEGIASLEKAMNNDIDVRGKEFETQRDSFVARIKEYLGNGQTQEAKFQQDQLNHLADPRPGIRLDYQSRLKPLTDDLDQLRKQLQDLAAKAVDQASPDQKSLEGDRTALLTKRQAASDRWAVQINAAQDELSLAQKRDAAAGEVRSQDQSRILDIDRELADREKQLAPMAQTDQVRRLAARIYGVDPEKVTVEQAGKIALVWFGSLAALAAIAGPVTAMVALGLQRLGDPTPERAGKLSRLLRAWLLKWRFRRTKRIEVIKEVPVDRPVEKIVEVPVEKIIKEILYVPILTDDPEAVRKALAEGVPAEIADLVQLKTKVSA
jgi:hypothetical protein